MQDGYHLNIAKRNGKPAREFGPHYEHFANISFGNCTETTARARMTEVIERFGQSQPDPFDEPLFIFDLTFWQSSGKRIEDTAPEWLRKHGRKVEQV